jgi:acyl-coenzyme A thioesterase PaaI-like protein
VVRQGQRIANCAIELWQDDRATMVAVARAHFLLTR